MQHLQRAGAFRQRRYMAAGPSGAQKLHRMDAILRITLEKNQEGRADRWYP